MRSSRQYISRDHCALGMGPRARFWRTTPDVLLGLRRRAGLTGPDARAALSLAILVRAGVHDRRVLFFLLGSFIIVGFTVN